jgi:hypothetical protein
MRLPEGFWDQVPAPAALVTAVRPDGSAVLSPADLIEVLAALEHAAGSLVDRAGQCCDDCGTHPAGACESHVDDLDQADALRAVAARLGEGAPAPAADGEAAAEIVAALDAALTASAQLAAVRAVMDWALNSRHGDSGVAVDKIGRILAGGAS